VKIDSKLKFYSHITVVTKKANRLVAIIRKMFQYFDKVTLINLYKTFVPPILRRIIWEHHLGTSRPAGSAEESNQIDQ